MRGAQACEDFPAEAAGLVREEHRQAPVGQRVEKVLDAG